MRLSRGPRKARFCRPLLSNIYLHYVLDLWFSRRVRPACDGEAYYFRFADDFLACFQYRGEADRFRQQLEARRNCIAGRSPQKHRVFR